jgi:hypothetical protein
VRLRERLQLSRAGGRLQVRPGTDDGGCARNERFHEREICGGRVSGWVCAGGRRRHGPMPRLVVETTYAMDVSMVRAWAIRYCQGGWLRGEAVHGLGGAVADDVSVGRA